MMNCGHWYFKLLAQRMELNQIEYITQQTKNQKSKIQKPKTEDQNQTLETRLHLKTLQFQGVPSDGHRCQNPAFPMNLGCDDYFKC
jgi:hypothetical protein